MYEKELIELSKAGVKYLVVGGIATNLSGYSKITFDLDLLVDLEKDNLGKIISILDNLGYIPRVPVKPEELLDPKKREFWYKEKNMKVFSFLNSKDPIKTIDLMIYNPINFNKAYKRKQIVKVKKENISVASLDDLIQLKEIAGRDKDKIHLKALRKLKEKYEDGK